MCVCFCLCVCVRFCVCIFVFLSVFVMCCVCVCMPVFESVFVCVFPGLGLSDRAAPASACPQCKVTAVSPGTTGLCVTVGTTASNSVAWRDTGGGGR